VSKQLVPARMTHRNNKVIIIEDKDSSWCPPCSEISMCQMEACKDLPMPMQVENCYESSKQLSYVSLHCEAGAT